jgi:hypothetical protein
MNLQRYVSTVYCENVFDEDYLKKLDEDVSIIDSTKTYKSLRNLYTEKYSSYVNKDSPEAQYILDKLFFDVLFGKTIGNLFNIGTHTIVLFPIFKDIDGVKRLNPSLRDIYRPILANITREPFTIKNKNMYMFVPVFSDTEESTDEYISSLDSYFERAFEFILDQKQKQAIIGDRVQLKDTKFENIIYTVDKDGIFFTDYYNKKLNSEKLKIVDSMVRKFVEKLGCKMMSVKNPIDKLNKDESIRKFKADGFGKQIEKLNPFFNLLERFLDYYKKTNNREYFKLSASTDNQSVFRIYYRVNNTDYKDTFDKIKTGSNFVYSISEPSFKVGYFIKKEGTGSSNKYIFREYTGLTSSLKTTNGITMEDLEQKEEEDSKNIAIPKEFVIETKGDSLKYRRVTPE